MVLLIGSLFAFTYSFFPVSVLEFPTAWLVITACGSLVPALVMRRHVERIIPAGSAKTWKGTLIVIIMLGAAAALFCLILYLSLLAVQGNLFIPIVIVFSPPDIAIVAWALARYHAGNRGKKKES
jgi:dolichol kinase